MADEYRSPSTSVAPSIETPKTEPGGMEKPGLRLSRLKGESTTSANMRQNERHAVKGHINRLIARPGSKLELATIENKFAVLKTWRNEKIKDRENKGNGSLQLCFPDEYTEEEEENWLRGAFPVILDEVLAQQDYDHDDEEPIPAKREIKKENGDDDVDTRRYSQNSLRHKKPGNRVAESYEEEKSSKLECWPCSRGLSISIGGDDFSCVINPGADAKLNIEVGPAVFRREANGDASEDVEVANRGAKRTWRWIGGKMVVWPPFDEKVIKDSSKVEVTVDES